MIGRLLIAFALAKDPCQGVVTEHPSYKESHDTIVKKVVGASQLFAIADEADKVLAKLIGAKSPVLMNWLKERNLMSASEEVIAQEWRRYYLDNFVLGQYPSKNKDINRAVENLFAGINTSLFKKEFKTKLNGLFKKVQADAIKMAKSWDIDEESKKQILHKFTTTKLYWFEQLEGSRYQDKPLEFIRWGLAYDPVHNEINVGVHALKYPTDASLYAVLAHELAHAIDSCRWSAFFQGQSPFTELNSCLRSPESTAAKTRDDSKMNRAIKTGVLTQELAQSLRLNPTCNKIFYPTGGNQKDQLPEVFADWFSAELFAKSSFKSQFPRPDLCDEKKLDHGSSYLEHRDRIAKIYLTQPQLQSTFKFETPAKYCVLEQAPKKAADQTLTH